MTPKITCYIRHATGGLLLTSLAFLVFTYWHNRIPDETARVRSPAFPSLPADVEGTVTGYLFRDTRDGCDIVVRGRRVTRRGKKVLGLRTNLMKTNYFELISGEIRTESETVTFSAEKGEGTLLGDSPLIMQENVQVTINGRDVPQVRRVLVYPRSGTMEIFAKQTQVYRFK